MKKLFATIGFLILMANAIAQTPEMYPPPDPEPVEITPLNIVLFVVMPIVLVIIFVLYMRWVKKRRRK